MVITVLMLLNENVYLTILEVTSPKSQSADLVPLCAQGRAAAQLSTGFW